MSTTDRPDRDQQAERGGAKGVLLAAGIAATGALGYGIGLGLARATQYAEEVEEDEFCRPALVPPQR